MGRKVEYIPDGVKRRATSEAISEACANYATGIPSGFFVATAQHEGALNEKDTEVSGFESYGSFQTSHEEASGAGKPDFFKNDGWWNDLDTQAAIFVFTMEKRLVQLKQTCESNGIEITDDIWGFLALGHNQGMGVANPSIVKHRCSWKDFEKGNAGKFDGMIKYGWDCITMAKSSGVVLSVRETLADAGAPITVAGIDGLVVLAIAVATLILVFVI